MEIWSQTLTDGHATVENTYTLETDEAPVIEKDPQWYRKHVRESQYLLLIVKRDDPSCCKPRRSSLFH